MNHAAAYRQHSVENAPPIKIVRMLFEGAIRFLEQAERYDVAADAVQLNDRIRRAEAIVSELRLALDASQAPELVDRLQSLYLFVEDELREAFLAGDKQHVANAKEILQSLLTAWSQLKIDPSSAVERARDAA